MSILIKGMKKPEACAKFEDGEFVHCPFVNTDDDCILQDKITDTWEEMYKNCPLIELPEKHGDLIDINSKIEVQFFDEQEDEWSLETVTVGDYLCYASEIPGVVVEAEGDEE